MQILVEQKTEIHEGLKNPYFKLKEIHLAKANNLGIATKNFATKATRKLLELRFRKRHHAMLLQHVLYG